jgi:hypothetical protein
MRLSFLTSSYASKSISKTPVLVISAIPIALAASPMTVSPSSAAVIAGTTLQCQIKTDFTQTQGFWDVCP